MKQTKRDTKNNLNQTFSHGFKYKKSSTSSSMAQDDIVQLDSTGQIYKTLNIGTKLYEFSERNSTAEKLNQITQLSMIGVQTTKERFNQQFLNEHEFMTVINKTTKNISSVPTTAAQSTRTINIKSKQLKDIFPVRPNSVYSSYGLKIVSQTERKSKDIKRGNSFSTNIDFSDNSEVISKKSTQKNKHAFSDVKKTNNYTSVIPIHSINSFPAWIRDRQDFSELYFSSQISQHLDIPKICSQPYDKRTLEDNLSLVQYLKGVEVIQNLKNEFYYYFSKYLVSHVYIEGEIISKKDFNDLSLVYQGEVREYVYGVKTKSYKTSSLINRGFMMDKKICEYRIIEISYQLKAEKNVILLSISFQDYHEVLNQCFSIHSKDFTSGLTRTNFFNAFQYETLIQISEKGQLVLYLKGEVIQKFQEPSSFFSIIYSGRLKCEWYHETFKQNKWPKDKRTWEIKTIQKRNIVSKVMVENEFFGDDEIINEKVTRTRIIAEENSFVVRVPKKSFKEIFCSEDLIYIRRCRNSITEEELQLNTQDDKGYKHQLNKERKKRLEDAMSLIFSQAQSYQEMEKKMQRYKRFQSSLDVRGRQ